MMEDEFDPVKISSRIYEKLKIPHYRLTDFLGYSKDFDLGINETIDTFETGISEIEREKQAIIDIEGKPRHRDLLPHVEENWKNLSILKTVANMGGDTWEDTWLDLSAQNISSTDESGEPLFPYYEKEEFTDLVADPQTDIGWFLFIPQTPETDDVVRNYPSRHTLINQQGIYFPETHFGIFYLFFNWRVEEWHYGGWYFATPEANTLIDYDTWNSSRFPFNEFNWEGAWINEPETSMSWSNGDNFHVEGGGFYLGPNAEILLDLQSRKHLGILNWWTSLQKKA